VTFRPLIIEVPHFASLRGEEREIAVLRSDDGQSWREHVPPSSEDTVHEMLEGHFEGFLSYYILLCFFRRCLIDGDVVKRCIANDSIAYSFIEKVDKTQSNNAMK